MTNVGQLLKIESVVKDFGYRKVLKGVCLSLRSSQATLLVGKNGVGKSTLLKIVAGLIRPSGGGIYFKDKNILRHPVEFRQSIGVISHSTHFYGELTARENLIFFARLGKIVSLSGKIKSALERTGLESVAELPVKTFSSGMNKRLNIARLMVSEPELLLLDEPYSGLDYSSIGFFNEYLAGIKKRGGSIFLVSHQIDTCFDLCDNIAILKSGRIMSYKETAHMSAPDLMEEYQRM